VSLDLQVRFITGFEWSLFVPPLSPLSSPPARGPSYELNQQRITDKSQT